MDSLWLAIKRKNLFPCPPTRLGASLAAQPCPVQAFGELTLTNESMNESAQDNTHQLALETRLR